MYNPVDINRIDRQIEELQRLKASYQSMNMPTQPINNIINTQQANKPFFEARFTNENPADVLIQNKTAFIDLKNNKLTIKEVDGETKEFGIIPPKDEKDIRIQQLENEIQILKNNYIGLQLNNSANVNNVSQNVQPNIPQQSFEQQKETSLEPIILDPNKNDYTVNDQQTLADKIGSKLKFKK